MRPSRFRLVLFLAVCSLAAAVSAAEPADPVPPPPLPPERQPPTAPDASAGAFEPEITITTRGTEIHEEYRYNGRLYRVKVTPRQGAPYYLIYDEHGQFYRSDAEPDVLVPQWTIKRF